MKETNNREQTVPMDREEIWSEIERDARRYNKAFTEEEEAKLR